jgi:hypothetical protein
MRLLLGCFLLASIGEFNITNLVLVACIYFLSN